MYYSIVILGVFVENKEYSIEIVYVQKLFDILMYEQAKYVSKTIK